jgi:hypothetical protein
MRGRERELIGRREQADVRLAAAGDQDLVPGGCSIENACRVR